MPRKYNRKNYRPRRRRRYNKALTSRSMAPLQPKLRALLKYEEEFTLNGVLASQVFSANGVFDPNISGIGHQPRGLDQLFTLYDHCTVIGAKMTLRALNTSTTVTANVGVAITDGSGAFSNSTDILEYRGSQIRTLSTLGSGKEQATVVYKLNPNKYLSISKPLSEDSVKNDVTQNPSEQIFFNIAQWNTQGGTSGNVDYVCLIEYDVIFTEPKQPVSS